MRRSDFLTALVSLSGARRGFRRSLLFAPMVTLALVLFMPANTPAQTVAGTIVAPAGTQWNEMVLYRAGEKLFVIDYTSARILVYDAQSLAPAGEIPLSSYFPDLPQSLVLHEGTGTLYLAISTGFATSDSRILVINANTHTIGPVLTGIGLDLFPTVDEPRARLYTLGRNSHLNETLTAIDVNTNTVVGSLDLDALMGGGLIGYSRSQLNPATGELFFTNLHNDKFVVVNGSVMTGQVVSATRSRGWEGTWNPLENKIYITTISWNGYFVYDRDTGSSFVTSCINDGTSLFFSAATRRVYSGAEVDGNSTVIEGGTDTCQNLEVGVGQAEVGFLNARRQVFFAGTDSVSVFDEDSLRRVASLTNCGSGGFGEVGTQIIADQIRQRVFVRSTWSDPARGSCILVIDVASFVDVPPSHIFWPWIEALLRAGITGGCDTNPPSYCPDQPVTRAQMAVFLLRGIHGAGYTPPTASGTVFADVLLSDPFAAWIEQLFAEGITGGCGTNPLRYCPDQSVTRGQMAVFLLRSKHGAGYQPPAATGIFADVPLDHPFARWIEQLSREGITGGCGTNPDRYCPDQPVTRGQMAVFLVRTFNLPM